ncbi:PilN domain-containing protein [Ketobacter sp.]|uniref:PilN domain-containing protein n=1 Tax=Ketobacter sp. TaxID=2083498 RepID=UPI000F224ED2|nr:PilN domain-containing protein [Ketobacter sp.]RLU01876.1 MAG: hypothetical protein D9N14_00820 [Ketobacter sp.]
MSAVIQRVNFYQDSFRKPVIVLPLKQMLMVVAAVVVAVIMLTVLEWSRTVHARNTLADMEASRTRMEASIERLQKEVDAIVLDTRLQQREKQLQQSLQGKRKFLGQLQQEGDTHHVHFSGYLQALSNMDTPSVWLTRIVMRSPGPELSLHGVTDKPKAIPDYISDLKQEEHFQGFGFRVFSLERMEEQNRFLTFSVSTQYDQQSAN